MTWQCGDFAGAASPARWGHKADGGGDWELEDEQVTNSRRKMGAGVCSVPGVRCLRAPLLRLPLETASPSPRSRASLSARSSGHDAAGVALPVGCWLHGCSVFLSRLKGSFLFVSSHLRRESSQPVCYREQPVGAGGIVRAGGGAAGGTRRWALVCGWGWSWQGTLCPVRSSEMASVPPGSQE